MPGIWTSSRITANSSCSSRRSASSPESARTSSCAERLEDRLEREQVLGPVVDEQELRAARLTAQHSP